MSDESNKQSVEDSITDCPTLTDGERLLVDRRRKGKSQGEVCIDLGIKQCTYASYEKDEERMFRHAPPLDIPTVEPVDPHEHVMILRTRLGLTLAQASVIVGTSRATYVQIEGGGRVALKWAVYAIRQLQGYRVTETEKASETAD